MRLVVKKGRRWLPGIVEYTTVKAAEERIAELKKVGIVARIAKPGELPY
jgi:hypothetical protein